MSASTINAAPTRPRYSVYTPSGVDWLEDIPAHWHVRRLRYLAYYVSRGRTPDYVDVSNIKVISQACIQDDNLVLDNIKYHKIVVYLRLQDNCFDS